MYSLDPGRKGGYMYTRVILLRCGAAHVFDQVRRQTSRLNIADLMQEHPGNFTKYRKRMKLADTIPKLKFVVHWYRRFCSVRRVGSTLKEVL